MLSRRVTLSVHLCVYWFEASVPAQVLVFPLVFRIPVGVVDMGILRYASLVEDTLLDGP